MHFYSTKKTAPNVSLKEAVLRSLPPDNGLYMPDEIDALPDAFWEAFPNMPFGELAYEVAQHLLKDSIASADLKPLVHDAVNFEAPLVPIGEDYACLELFHGPSLAFKDFGARFMARLMSHLVKGDNRQLDILVATSGDTGGAVALGFYGTPNIRVTILYPSGKVSLLQEKQLTTLGKNIRAIEVKGTFDDCQALVKQAFLDKELNAQLQLSSANSINIARLVPQTFYYFRAYQHYLKTGDKRPFVMCVPSGNFGNITAGLFAKKMGLPIHQFIASNNRNNVFQQYYLTGQYSPRPSVATPSNAMDVGNPSNFQRMMDIYGNSVESVREDIASYSYNDEQTLEGVVELKEKFDYVACPHTAVAWLAAKEYKTTHPDEFIVFQATAHAAKFIDIVEDSIGEKVVVPKALEILRNREKIATLMDTTYDSFKDYLMDNI